MEEEQDQLQDTINKTIDDAGIFARKTLDNVGQFILTFANEQLDTFLQKCKEGISEMTGEKDAEESQEDQ